MKLKKIINFGTIFATMSLVSTPVVSFAETADEILNIKNNINETKDNTLAPESENNTVNTTVPSNSEVENSQDSSVLPDEKIASPEEKISEKSIGIPNVEFNNDVPTSYIPSSTGISFTWNLNTIKDTQEIKQGDKIVLNISGEGLDYSTIRFASGGSSDPYFDLVIDEKNGQILLVAKQDVNFNGNISVSITGRPTGVEGPLDFPFTSSYISSEITSELLAENMVLHVKNSGGSWAIVGTPVTPGVNWNALEADGHGLYQPNNNGTGLPGKFYYTQNAQNWFAGIFNGKYNNISGSGPYIFTVESNYPIDTDSLKISGGKIGEMHDASTEYSTQWSDDNKVLSIVFNELTSSGSMGSAIAADFYVLTNTINDTVSIKTSAVDANGVSIGTGSNGVGTYYPTNSGSFLPFITAKDATVYTTDAPIDLLGLAEAYDQIDGDITDNIKIINNGGFDQSKPGEYKINYQVINSKGESAEYTNLVTVKENKSSIKGHDSTIYVGEKWTASDNFDSALDKDGNEVDFSKITVSGEVDTTKPGEYPITYSYEGISTTITVTVKENKSSIKGHDSTIYVGEKWTASDNFDSALDKDGNEIDFSKITVSGEVDTTKPGEYPITYSYEGISTAITVTVKENKSSIKGHDSTIYVGEKWTASDNFDSALDKDGNEIDFSKITVSGEVDTTKPGEYPITYSYEGISTTITVTVKENKSSIKGHDSTIYVGEKWTASDNFDSALDKDGNEIDFSKITVSGEVDTTKPGEYPITYSYEG
ncbi:bacterial Ig-like domain-containing protein, partial [Enterococcus faecalis]|nr:bacterial Ig-like domain-containing protein [Enterococcus faecalis]NSU75770.1 bacterial Ig-like domain-containing protein [Enterococcus faecalis]NSV34017.1 bacterial Ig-like domain-containing protein [Enterococcus faecalis]